MKFRFGKLFLGIGTYKFNILEKRRHQETYIRYLFLGEIDKIYCKLI